MENAAYWKEVENAYRKLRLAGVTFTEEETWEAAKGLVEDDRAFAECARRAKEEGKSYAALIGEYFDKQDALKKLLESH